MSLYAIMSDEVQGDLQGRSVNTMGDVFVNNISNNDYAPLTLGEDKDGSPSQTFPLPSTLIESRLESAPLSEVNWTMFDRSFYAWGVFTLAPPHVLVHSNSQLNRLRGAPSDSNQSMSQGSQGFETFFDLVFEGCCCELSKGRTNSHNGLTKLFRRTRTGKTYTTGQSSSPHPRYSFSQESTHHDITHDMLRPYQHSAVSFIASLISPHGGESSHGVLPLRVGRDKGVLCLAHGFTNRSKATADCLNLHFAVMFNQLTERTTPARRMI